MEYWNNYWSLNLNGDCFSLDGNSELSLIMSGFWSNYFAQKGENTYALDLACGNGFVGKCAIKNASNLYCIGVDQSRDLGKTYFEDKINKSYLRLLPDTPLEDLKFVDNEFDSIVSQFGFEYSPNNHKVLSNIYRQLKPSGEIKLIIHSVNSVIYKRSQSEVKVLDFLLNKCEVFNKLYDKRGLRSMRDSLLDECRGMFPDCIEVIESLLVNLNIYLDALLANKDVSDKKIQELETIYIQHGKRLEEQINVSYDQNKVQTIMNSLEGLQYSHVEYSSFEKDGFGVIGWLVEAKKS